MQLRQHTTVIILYLTDQDEHRLSNYKPKSITDLGLFHSIKTSIIDSSRFIEEEHNEVSLESYGCSSSDWR